MLAESLKAGDWLLPHGSDSHVAKIIRKLTFGSVNHAVMVVDSNTVFETDGAWFKAKYNPISRYIGKEMYIVRPLFYKKHNDKTIKTLCDKYLGTIYDYVQIGVTGVLSFLHPQIQQKVVGLLTSNKFMICSELTARITFEATGQKLLQDYEGITPEALKELSLNNPDLFIVEHVLSFNPKTL